MQAKLALECVKINDIQFADETIVKNNVLYINRTEMQEFIASPLAAEINIELARPGESVRIIPVKDVIEPRIKMSPKGGAFPGFFGRVEECGEGITKVLKGCSVVTCGTILGFQEGIIDMSGPATEFCRFSALNNVVVHAKMDPEVSAVKREEAMRIMGLKAAYYLSLKTKDAPVDYTEDFSWLAPKKDLPKVGLMYMTMAQGLLHDNYLYGVDAKRLHTTLVHPNEILDGAMVNGTCVVASDKFTTYDHQNNPMIGELYKRHGEELNFRGVIVVPTYTVLKDKQRCTASAVRIARMLELDGVIIPEEGGGNPEADLMQMIKGCERAGIKTVGLLTALGGEEGISDTAEEADAIINTGYDDLDLELPAMDTVIGDLDQVKVLAGGYENSLHDDGSIFVSIISIMGAHNQMGATDLSSRVL